MVFVLLLAIALVFCFAAVLLFGAPYLPTLKPKISAALELADLKPGQTLIELGCGDGRVVLAAAENGLNVVGYELNPLLAFIAWLKTRRYRRQVKIIWGNYWHKAWPEADAIYTFLLPRYMSKLDKKCMQYKYKPVKLVSFAFNIPDRKASKHLSGLYLYVYK